MPGRHGRPSAAARTLNSAVKGPHKPWTPRIISGRKKPGPLHCTAKTHAEEVGTKLLWQAEFRQKRTIGGFATIISQKKRTKDRRWNLGSKMKEADTDVGATKARFQKEGTETLLRAHRGMQCFQELARGPATALFLQATARLPDRRPPVSPRHARQTARRGRGGRHRTPDERSGALSLKILSPPCKL